LDKLIVNAVRFTICK